MRIGGKNLSGLAAFEMAASLGSFTQAAQSLHITTGAVSQQIRLLEQQLNLTLFERHSRGIKLTRSGEQLFHVVHRSFSDIQQCIEELQQDNSVSGEIRLKLTPSFAFKWLVPRLHNFYQLYPDISIQTFAEGALVNHQDTSFDLVIDYGKCPENTPNAYELIQEKLIPVMSPAYQALYDWESTISKSKHDVWENVTLLHDAMPFQEVTKDFEWRFWFKKMGIQIDSQRGHFFNRTDMAMAAAEAGVGIAMARYALVADDFKKNKLVSPFDPISSEASYFLVQHRTSDPIEYFKHWLFKQCN